MNKVIEFSESPPILQDTTERKLAREALPQAHDEDGHLHPRSQSHSGATTVGRRRAPLVNGPVAGSPSMAAALDGPTDRYAKNGDPSDMTRRRTTYALDLDTSSFVIEEYNWAPAFSNFLPGIAGAWGILCGRITSTAAKR